MSRGVEVAGLLGLVNADDGAEPVVVLRPVHHADVTARETLLESGVIEYSPESPPRMVILGVEQHAGQRPVAFRLHGGPAQQRPRPPCGPEVTPELVLPWLADRVVLTREMLDREAHGDRLLVSRVWLLGGVRLACLGARFGPGHVLRVGQCQQVAMERGIYGVQRLDRESRPDSMPRTTTPATRSPLLQAVSGRCGPGTNSWPPSWCGAIIWCSTATATRGSWHSGPAHPLPGLRWGWGWSGFRRRRVGPAGGPRSR